MWRNTYQFKYDAAHHLTFIGYPDGTHKDLAYEDQGRVSLFSDRAQKGVTCRETYQYGENAPVYYWVRSERKCSDGAVVNRAFFDTRMALDEDGRVIGPMRRRQWTATGGLIMSVMNPASGQVISTEKHEKAEEPTPEQ